MKPLNDNICECGHQKVLHHIDKQFTPKACSLNQKECDCWEFKMRYVEHREYALHFKVTH